MVRIKEIALLVVEDWYGVLIVNG